MHNKVDQINALCKQGLSLRRRGRPDKAIGYYEQALAIDIECDLAWRGLSAAVLSTCNWEDIARLRGPLGEMIKAGMPRCIPHSWLMMSDDPQSLLQCAQNHTRMWVPEPLPRVWKGESYKHPKIRVGYLSANFNNHAMSSLITGLFEKHDRTRFEIVGLSYGKDDGSDQRERVTASFDRFADLAGADDQSAANLIRKMEIDILVDLQGYTQNCRPRIAARRPSPIQVSYLGFPGSMGADFIDYIIADAIVAPFAEQPFFSERIVQLPDTYWVTDDKLEVGAALSSREEAGLPSSGFVFCCFNQSIKINLEIFNVWMDLLKAIRNSVLWLIRDHAAAEGQLRAEAARRGIDPMRLIFAPRVSRRDHLARIRFADLCLDTLPYNAHTTASDALWMGVPQISIKGKTFVGRVSASLLTALGLPELVTENLDDYRTLALHLATDSAALNAIKERIVLNRTTCPLFSTDRFRESIEAAYSQMWWKWQRGQAPQAFAIRRRVS